jgi:uncharacterized damage-inducible protein DinB
MSNQDSLQAAGWTSLNWTRDVLEKLLDTLSDEQMMHRPCPGGNHALWTVGHLAITDDVIPALVGGPDARSPEPWREMFKDGSTPHDDASAYPSVDELRTALRDYRAHLVEWFRSMDEAKLREPLPEDWQPFAPTHAALVAGIAAHEAMHVGQLTVIRKSLGMKPAMM